MALAWPAGYFGAKFVVAPLIGRALPGGKGLPADLINELAVWAAWLLLGCLTIEALRPRTSTLAFRIGAEGEEKVGRALDALARHGYRAIHDVPLRGWGNIDHVLVGPGGVFTVETKNTAGTVRIRGGRIRQAGHNREDHIAQARRQAEAVANKIARDPALSGVGVIPVVCYVKAEIETGWFGSNTINGVRVVNIPGLKGVKKYPQRLTVEGIDLITTLLSPPLI
ncbi:MAG TPA: nuclease-related domain-containing protein [Actinomycetota bacterium]